MNIHEALKQARVELCGAGISKEGQAPAAMGGYKFRGIDDIYNVIGPLMAKYGISFLPQVQDVIHNVYKSVVNNKDRTTQHYVVKVRYVISADEGEPIFCEVYGEAADTADKGMNKAMTSAYKNAIFQTFAPPLNGTPIDMDTRSETTGPMDSEADAAAPMETPVEDQSQDPADGRPMGPAIDADEHRELSKLIVESQANISAILAWLTDQGLHVIDLKLLPKSWLPKLTALLEKQKVAIDKKGGAK